ncbi:MAG: hypothetical protein HZA77_08960 [Candidatus Schekmanbacteria bacterium]|nr:hypothetical protein [Candidatus Schekmanbacteria bacterium]
MENIKDRQFKADISLYLGLFLLSVATLTLEILQTRIASILLWPLSVYFVISLALLGFGASGACISVFHSFFRKRVFESLVGSSIGFSLSILLFFAAIPIFNQVSSHESFGLLTFLSVILGLPFFFAGLCVSLILSLWVKEINKLYFVNLVGSGIGSVVILKTLTDFSGETNLFIVSITASLVALIFSFKLSKKYSLLIAIYTIVVALTMQNSIFYDKIVPIVTKELKQMNRFHPERKHEYQKWDPIARVDVAYLKDDYIYLPEKIAYKMVFQDGDAPSIILNFNKDFDKADFTDQTILGIPYWIKNEPEVLIIGIGGGPDVATALHFKSKKITGVEINKRMIEIVKNNFKDFAGRPYERNNVNIFHAEGRHFTKLSREKYDIIQLTGVDTYIASFGGTQNLSESYLYTTEALRNYFAHLKDNGVISITYPNWGAGIRLFVMAFDVLKDLGINNPEGHLIVSESCGFVNIMIKNTPFTNDEIDMVESHFTKEMYGIYFPLFYKLWGGEYPKSFFSENKVLYKPHSTIENDYLRYYKDWSVGKSEEFIKSYPKNISPVSDTSPFFFVQDKWGSHTPIFNTFLRMLAVLTMLTLLFILLPLYILKKDGLQIKDNISIIIYFLGLGAGYMFIEIAFLQKAILFLGHPSFSIAITLLILLIASGVGSLYSKKFEICKSLIIIPIVLLSIFILGYILFLGKIFNTFLSYSFLVRSLITALVLFPSGFLMGIPFPTGLKIVGKKYDDFVPWAWGINASASVIGAILAPFIAMNLGFNAVFYIAAIIYLLGMAGMLLFSKNILRAN